jgi:hypothetical protein
MTRQASVPAESWLFTEGTDIAVRSKRLDADRQEIGILQTESRKASRRPSLRPTCSVSVGT